MWFPEQLIAGSAGRLSGADGRSRLRVADRLDQARAQKGDHPQRTLSTRNPSFVGLMISIRLEGATL